MIGTFNPDSFRLDSELNGIVQWIQSGNDNDDSEPYDLCKAGTAYSYESLTSSENSWNSEDERPPIGLQRAFSQDTFGEAFCQCLYEDARENNSCDSDDSMSALTDDTQPLPRPQFQGKIFNLQFLFDYHTFFTALLNDLQDENEKKQLLAFATKLQTSPFGARALNKVAKRTFGKDYLRGSGLTNAKIRDHMNLLEMMFYAIACRHLAMKTNFSMTKEAFLERFKSVLSSFAPQASHHSLTQSCVNFYQQLELAENEAELELMVRFVAPVLILEEHGCNHTFFHRKSGLLVALGEFMEFSGRQYTSGGGKTLPTKIREACLDLVTGNARSKRNRKSKNGATSPSRSTSSQRKKKKGVKLTMSAKEMRKQAKAIMESSDSDSDSESESDSSEMDEEDPCDVEYKRSFY